MAEGMTTTRRGLIGWVAAAAAAAPFVGAKVAAAIDAPPFALTVADLRINGFDLSAGYTISADKIEVRDSNGVPRAILNR